MTINIFDSVNSEIAERRARKAKFTELGIGLEFANSLTKQLSFQDSISGKKDELSFQRQRSYDLINEEIKDITQVDLTKAILGGIALNTDTISRIARSREEVKTKAQQKINEEYAKAYEALSDTERNNVLGGIFGFGLGALGWLLL